MSGAIHGWQVWVLLPGSLQCGPQWLACYSCPLWQSWGEPGSRLSTWSKETAVSSLLPVRLLDSLLGQLGSPPAAYVKHLMIPVWSTYWITTSISLYIFIFQHDDWINSEFDHLCTRKNTQAHLDRLPFWNPVGCFTNGTATKNVCLQRW